MLKFPQSRPPPSVSVIAAAPASLRSPRSHGLLQSARVRDAEGTDQKTQVTPIQTACEAIEKRKLVAAVRKPALG